MLYFRLFPKDRMFLLWLSSMLCVDVASTCFRCIAAFLRLCCLCSMLPFQLFYALIFWYFLTVLRLLLLHWFSLTVLPLLMIFDRPLLMLHGFSIFGLSCIAPLTLLSLHCWIAWLARLYCGYISKSFCVFLHISCVLSGTKQSCAIWPWKYHQVDSINLQQQQQQQQEEDI